MEDRYSVIIAGSSLAGTAAAFRLNKMGYSTCLIDKEKLFKFVFDMKFNRCPDIPGSFCLKDQTIIPNRPASSGINEKNIK